MYWHTFRQLQSFRHRIMLNYQLQSYEKKSQKPNLDHD